MIEIKPMDERYLHLCCLHYGPIDTATREPPSDDAAVDLPPRPWSDETLGQLKAKYPKMFGHVGPPEFVREMIDRYGTCAILAWDGRKVVGHLRFYPMKVARLLFASKRACTEACKPEDDDGALWVLCVMTCRPYRAAASCPAMAIVTPKGKDSAAIVTTPDGKRRFRTREEAGARKGTGLKLAQGLISWAREHGWKRIVHVAHCDLDWHYGCSGAAGKAFWEKAGFRVVGTYIERGWTFKEDDWAIVQAQMAEKGMTEDDIWTYYRMAYDL